MAPEGHRARALGLQHVAVVAGGWTCVRPRAAGPSHRPAEAAAPRGPGLGALAQGRRERGGRDRGAPDVRAEDARGRGAAGEAGPRRQAHVAGAGPRRRGGGEVLPQPAQPSNHPGAPGECIRSAALRGRAGDPDRPRAHEGDLRPMKDIRSIVKRALITEKGTVLRELRNQYFFEVARDANKIEIKRAVESIFNVKVKAVQTLQIRGKVKRQGRFAGRRSDWKKAVVTLQPDQKIELFEQI